MLQYEGFVTRPVARGAVLETNLVSVLTLFADPLFTTATRVLAVSRTLRATFTGGPSLTTTR